MRFEDFVNFLTQNKSLILAALAALSGFATILQSWMLFRLTGSVKKVLKAAKQRGTFTVCPKCGTEIKLSEIEFRLPDGSVDNDLNGIPDKEE